MASTEKSIATGAIWTMLSGAGIKLITFGGQIVLAWFLVPQDFGLAAMAMSLSAITTLFSAASMHAILISRFDQFNLLAPQVLWLGFLIHCIAGGILVLGANQFAGFYHEPQVSSLVVLLGVMLPVSAMIHPYTVKLQGSLRFGKVSMIHFMNSLVIMSGSLIMAYAGYGAYALIAPKLAGEVFSLFLTRVVAGPITLARPDLRLWKSLIGPSVLISVVAFLSSMLAYIPTFILGNLRDAAVVGVYFWGMQMSSQVIFVVVGNLRNVIFPGFATIKHDSKRLSDSFEKIMSVLMVLVSAICCLQYLSAEPAIKLIFAQKWYPAIPVVELLSLGMLLIPANIMSISMLYALERYRLLALIHAIQIVIMAVFVYRTGVTGSLTQIASSISMAFIINSLVCVMIAAGQLEISRSMIIRRLITSLLTVIPALLGGLIARAFAENLPPLQQLVIIGGVFVIAWLCSGPWLNADSRHVIQRLFPALSRW